MGSVLVIVLPPCADDLAGMTVAGEQMLVEALIPEPAIEALDEAVLHRLSRCDIVPLDAAILLPFKHRIACQLGAALRIDPPDQSVTDGVADHHTGVATMLSDGIKFAGNALT